MADRARRELVRWAVEPGCRLLDLGTGTGALAILAARNGASVVGIDPSPGMLTVAGELRAASDVGDRVRFIEAGVAEMEDHLSGSKFEAVTAFLVFSELSEDEQRYALRQAFSLLESGGRLAIADETRPSGVVQRVLYYTFRAPLALATWVLTQAATHPVIGLEDKVMAAGFQIQSVKRFNMGSFFILMAKKGKVP